MLRFAEDGIRIIQLASTALDSKGDSLPCSSFNELIYTKRPILDRGDDNKSIHGIKKKDLEGRDDFETVGKRWADWIDSLCESNTAVIFVAYNGFATDFRHLARELERNNIALPSRSYICIDPLTMIRGAPEAKEWFANVPQVTATRKVSQKVKDVTEFILRENGNYSEDDDVFEMKCGKAHDALADVRALEFILTSEKIWAQRGGAWALSWMHFKEYAEKAVDYERYWSIPKKVNEAAVNHGKEHEKEAIEKYMEDTGLKVIEMPLIVHPRYDFLAASPDGVILSIEYEPRGLEVKCPHSVFQGERDFSDDDIEKYIYQLQMQMEVLGMDSVFLRYNPANEESPPPQTVHRDPNFLRNNMHIFEKFMADVEKRKMMPLKK